MPKGIDVDSGTKDERERPEILVLAIRRINAKKNLESRSLNALLDIKDQLPVY